MIASRDRYCLRRGTFLNPVYGSLRKLLLRELCSMSSPMRQARRHSQFGEDAHGLSIRDTASAIPMAQSRVGHSKLKLTVKDLLTCDRSLQAG